MSLVCRKVLVLYSHLILRNLCTPRSTYRPTIPTDSPSTFSHDSSRHSVDTVSVEYRSTIGGISIDCRIIKCITFRFFLKARTREASCMGDCTCYGPYDPTTLTSRKPLLKNRLPIRFKLFRDNPDSPCYLKERNFVWHWREVTAPDFRIYRLADPFLFSSKLKIWSFHVVAKKYQWGIGGMSVAYRSTCRPTIGQPLSADISIETRPPHWSTCRPSVGRYIDRHIGRVSVDMSTKG